MEAARRHGLRLPNEFLQYRVYANLICQVRAVVRQATESFAPPFERKTLNLTCKQRHRSDDEQNSVPGGHFAAWEEPEPFAAELRAASKAVHSTCFPCHATVKARDFVFNRTLIGERLMVNVTCNKLTAVSGDSGHA